MPHAYSGRSRSSAVRRTRRVAHCLTCSVCIHALRLARSRGSAVRRACRAAPYAGRSRGSAVRRAVTHTPTQCVFMPPRCVLAGLSAKGRPAVHYHPLHHAGLAE
eukprot:3177170-Lingulodinium_polyedra.AAC.1